MTIKSKDFPYIKIKNIELLHNFLCQLIIMAKVVLPTIVSVEEHRDYILFINYLCTEIEIKILLPLVESTDKIVLEMINHPYIPLSHFNDNWILKIINIIESQPIDGINKILKFYNIPYFINNTKFVKTLVAYCTTDNCLYYLKQIYQIPDLNSKSEQKSKTLFCYCMIKCYKFPDYINLLSDSKINTINFENTNFPKTTSAYPKTQITTYDELVRLIMSRRNHRVFTTQINTNCGSYFLLY